MCTFPVLSICCWSFSIPEYEVNLIRLIDKITNGTAIEVNETGTSLYFQPGLLHGGDFSHECCRLRAISYYLEVLMALGPFCKKPINCTLTGVTNAKVCLSNCQIFFSTFSIFLNWNLMFVRMSSRWIA